MSVSESESIMQPFSYIHHLQIRVHMIMCVCIYIYIYTYMHIYSESEPTTQPSSLIHGTHFLQVRDHTIMCHILCHLWRGASLWLPVPQLAQEFEHVQLPPCRSTNSDSDSNTDTDTDTDSGSDSGSDSGGYLIRGIFLFSIYLFMFSNQRTERFSPVHA